MGLLAALAAGLALAGVSDTVPDGAQPTLTADARTLVYVQNGRDGAQVVARDRRTRRSAAVSVSSSGARANASSLDPAVSDDGRFVSFCSCASNLAPRDELVQTGFANRLDQFRDVFVRDRRARRTTRVSVGRGGAKPNGWSCHATISGNGRVVAFVSAASNLAAGDGDGQANVFVHDRVTRRTTRLAGMASDSSGAKPSLSRDGRWLAYSVGGSLFLRDLRTGRTTTVGSGGGAQISADGRRVAFTRGPPMRGHVYDRSTRRTLDLGDANAVRIAAGGRFVASHWHDRITLHDLRGGGSTRVDVPSFGGYGWSAAFVGGISADARVISYVAQSSDGLPAGQHRQALVLRAR